MEQLNGSSNEYYRVRHAAGVLASQACTVSAKHIQDGMLRLQFNREVAYYAQSIVRDVAEGRKSPERGLRELIKSSKDLALKSAEIGQKSVGIVAGVAMTIGGGAMCVGSYMAACPLGAVIAAQGVNNVIENSVNLWNGDSKMQGPVRKIYHNVGNLLGADEISSDKAYAGMDLVFSGVGLFRKIPKANSWKLFRKIPTDFVSAYKTTSKPALTLEIISDAITLEQLRQLNNK